MTTVAQDIVERVEAAIATEHSNEARARAALQACHHADLVKALNLARNRLRAAAINAAPSGGREYYEYSQWADEADAILTEVGEAA
jgi:hypothetical protein